MVQLKRIFRTTALAAFAAVLAGLLSGQAQAEPGRSWTLESRSGQVSLVKTGMTPISLSTGDVFADGDWIETGPDGRALLRRGEETIVVAPNSRIGLPENNNGPYATRILQTLGTILLTVEKKAARHFEVETPYLTAVVKGTTFTVGIQDGRAVVHVVEGLVEVKNLSSGRSSLVRPGQTGSVLRGGGNIEIGGGDVKAAPAAPAAPARDANQVTAPASQASPVAVMAVSKGKSGKVRILEALGPTTLDLNQSTKGLVRAARGGQATALGKGFTAGKKTGIAREVKARSKGHRLSKSAGVARIASDLKAIGKAAKPIESARVASGPSISGSTVLAPSKSVDLSANSRRSGRRGHEFGVGKSAGAADGKNKGHGNTN